VRLETYIMREEGPATWLCTAMLRARARGVQVFMMIDAFGSETMREQFLRPLHDAGIQLRIFNPKRLLRLSFRNHRKLLAVDGEHAVLGGFNIAPEYAGDGVTRGWCDTGVVIHGPIVAELEHSFDLQFRLAPFTAGALRRFQRATGGSLLSRKKAPRAPAGPPPPVSLVASGPGMPQGVLRRRLRIDLFHARDVAIASAYFLPELPVRRLLYRTLRMGGRVRVLLAGRTDVPLARHAAERLYRRLLRRRVQIYEYQPQILHAKLLVMDDLLFVGSCNLDRRSLHINYELLLRLHWPELAADARRWFEHALMHSRAVNAREWKKQRSFMRRLWSRMAYLLLARIDPLVARRRFRALS
jgi:cardiolipin synthase